MSRNGSKVRRRWFLTHFGPLLHDWQNAEDLIWWANVWASRYQKQRERRKTKAEKGRQEKEEKTWKNEKSTFWRVFLAILTIKLGKIEIFDQKPPTNWGLPPKNKTRPKTTLSGTALRVHVRNAFPEKEGEEGIHKYVFSVFVGSKMLRKNFSRVWGEFARTNSWASLLFVIFEPFPKKRCKQSPPSLSGFMFFCQCPEMGSNWLESGVLTHVDPVLHKQKTTFTHFWTHFGR